MGKKLQLCECGCGEYAKLGNKYINGHQNCGRECSAKKRDKLSHSLKVYYQDNPEAIKRLSELMIGNKVSDATRKNLSQSLMGHEVTDETRKKISESEMGCYVSDETREKLSESLNEFYSKFDDPGQLLVKHHYIYDHNDLSKYTTEMTRSRHSRLHMLMRKAGIIIPHINIKEVN